mmetsp:Transcript_47921/g.70936  ORF Transcript_47921/g.70936 Transcript_47921/m.70936 type:complete len:399 (+) Transcript_47921:117-1313(+)|eukprot:CAMPEP_0195522690 /NCGR_PEP_ID=MMETSP0794_2-20130614/21095_1 /TAXON_ID=515487 /ORGANISM="Stephanopyxis turris, Strain CCMP 815" /LENGTH=398 /DNA_ID=CAMNT_0040652505 /DNA_START=107 /DNA_END=1303 /DNA_ORIENTATION=+
MMFQRKALVVLLSLSAASAFTFTLKNPVNSNAFGVTSCIGRPTELKPLFSDAVEGNDEAAAAVVEEVPVIAEAEEPVVAEEAAAEPAAPVEEDPKIYIGNLNFDLDKQAITALFEPFGTVSDCYVPLNRETGAGRGFAFVTMPDKEAAQNAIDQLNETEVAGRTVYVNEAGAGKKNPRKSRERPVKLYVGNLSFDTEAEGLTEYFAQFGPVSDCYIPEDRVTGRPRGFAFVSMTPADAEVAIEQTDGYEFDGRVLKVNKSLSRSEKEALGQTSGGGNRNYGSSAGTKLYVGNLSFDTEEQTVRDMFEEYGEITDYFMPMDRDTGRPRGFAFVTMAPENAERAAMETDGYELDGRILRVNEAQPKGASRGGGGGYGNNNSWGNDDSWDNDSSAQDGDAW